MKALRIVGYALGGIAALALVGIITVYILSERMLDAHPTPQMSKLAKPTGAQLANGARQLSVLGCRGCHGDTLQGEIFLDEPGVATLYAPNLTLVAAKASDAQLDQAIRQGISHDGRPLLIMPSEGYQFLTDREVAALIAAIRATPKGGTAQPAPSVGPKGRLGLVLGRFSTAPELVAKFRASPLADFGPQFARGRHIVQVNCTECHGPQLQGQQVGDSVSVDLSIAGAYDLDQFRTMLRAGVAPGGRKLGLMGAVARRDFAHLTDQEIADIHDYLVERARRAP